MVTLKQVRILISQCCGGCKVDKTHKVYNVPDSAFADANNPTIAEAKIWGDANIPENERKYGATLWYKGIEENPDYVWMYGINESGNLVLQQYDTIKAGLNGYDTPTDAANDTSLPVGAMYYLTGNVPGSAFPGEVRVKI